MDYVLESSYSQFIRENELNRIKMEAYIEECLIIAEGTNVIPKLRALNEDIGDKIKEGWNKFTQFIQRIWAKFVENMTRLFNTDTGYLEKYKDIILGKKIKDGKVYTMREYNIGLHRMASTSVPIFASNLLGDINNKDDADLKFKQRLIRDYDGKTEWAEFCKTYFQGGPDEKDFDAHSINMTDIYNFCRDKDKIYGNIEKDQKVLTNSANAAQKELTAKINDLKSASNQQQQQQNTQSAQQNNQQNQNNQQPTQNSQQKPQNNGQAQNASAVFSNVFGTVISELTIGSSTSAANANSSTNNSNIANSGSNTSSMKANSNQNIDKSNVQTNAQDKANLANTDIKTLEDKINIYQSDCSTILTAKMTATNIIYKDYMKIIRDHVSSYVGTDKSSDNVTAKAGSDYATANKLPELSKEQIADINNSVNAAENEQDQKKKTDLQNEAIQKAKNISSNFKGDYNAVKQWSGWQPPQK